VRSIPELGVGLIYFSGMESAVQSLSGYIDTIEIEPQTSWFKESLESDVFTYDRDFTAFLNSLPQPKIFHGVGFPIGGTILPNEAHFKTLNSQIADVQPVYTSEHLSFNKFKSQSDTIHQLNFLLPPLQNEMGVQTAVSSINWYKQNISQPFAFETGTNYLRPQKNEMPDGQFIRSVAEESDAYILLDLHNLLANELNGRQRVKDVINQLPLERVIEVHLAGGMYFNNYYLDAHSSISSQEFLQLTQEIVSDLPALKSIVFEMLPEYLGNNITTKQLEKQLISMHRLWETRGSSQKKKIKTNNGSNTFHQINPEEWEKTLGCILNGIEDEPTDLRNELMADEGIDIIKTLIFEFRASSVVSALKMTTRLIKLHIGSEKFNQLLKNFCTTNESELSGIANAMRFADYIQSIKPEVPFLEDILAFELNAIRTNVDGIERTVDFYYDPYPLFEDLINYRRPESRLNEGTIYRVQIKPDNINKDEKGALQYNSVLHS
jgi:uncharacterized protein